MHSGWSWEAALFWETESSRKVDGGSNSIYLVSEATEIVKVTQGGKRQDGGLREEAGEEEGGQGAIGSIWTKERVEAAEDAQVGYPEWAALSS